jgi:hypothetical protein
MDATMSATTASRPAESCVLGNLGKHLSGTIDGCGPQIGATQINPNGIFGHERA